MLSYFRDGVSVGNLPYTNWDEISGLTRAAKSANAGYFWAIDDGVISPCILLAVNSATAASGGEWTLTSSTGTDIEDIASATVSGQSYIYVADIGDNSAVRTTVNIYRIKEPTITGSNGTLASGTDYETIVCDYPGSPVGEGGTARRDAESLLVDPDTGDMYVITKRTTVPQVFKLAHASSYTGTQTFTSMGDMYALPTSVQASGATNGGRAVAADITPDGTEILVKNYTDVYLFTRNKGSQTIYQALQGTPTLIPAYVGGGQPSSHPNNEPQGESVVYDWNGVNFFTASEANTAYGSSSTAYPLFRYDRLSTALTTATFQEGVSSYAGTSDTYITSLAADKGTNFGAATAIIVDYNSGTDERYGLLKFDLSTIPNNATIVGCDLQLTITTEGSSFQIYKMYETWTESTTWNSLGHLPAFNDVQAASVADATHTGYATLTGAFKIKIPPLTVQNWVSGKVVNNGWVLYSNDIAVGNGFQFGSSEHGTTASRPLLTIRYYLAQVAASSLICF